MSYVETVTQTLTGNGLVIERTDRVGGAIPWWWIADASRVPKTLSQTYRHREMLKANGCRWSKKRASWYWMGVELPAAIAALVGSQDTISESATHDRSPAPSPRYAPPPTATAASFRETPGAHVTPVCRAVRPTGPVDASRCPLSRPSASTSWA
jgi:hypothetical protein